MSRNPSANLDNKVYVGDLGNNASKGELEDAFSYYGRLRSVWVARNPPGFAFIEFEDPRDAEDAVRGLDGRSVCGRRVRVELSTGRSRSRGHNGPSRNRGRPFHPEDRCYECGSRGHYARDCPLYSRGRKRSGSRSNSRSRSRSRSARSRSRSARTRSRSVDRRSRSRSRSKSRDRRSKSSSVRGRARKSVDRSRSRSRSPRDRQSKSRSRDRSDSRSHSRSRSRSVKRSPRSVSPHANGDD